MTVNEIVIAKLGTLYPTSITSTDVTIGIDEVAEKIKNYCSLETIPDALRYTQANMVIELLRYQYESKVTTLGTASDVEFDSSDVSSITVGDTSIGLKGGNSNSPRSLALKSHVSNLDDLVFNYREDLNKFRRMVW